MKLEAKFTGYLGCDMLSQGIRIYCENPTYQCAFRVRTGVLTQPLRGSRPDLKCSPALCEQAITLSYADSGIQMFYTEHRRTLFF